MKSLKHFPKRAAGGLLFDADSYGIDVREQVAMKSDFEGSYGVELELEGRNLPERYSGAAVDGVTWVTHNEGSLRNGGREYVLSQPASIDVIRQLSTNLFDDIARQGGVINNSTRCSTHIHINMRGFKLNQLAAFVILYGTFENVLTNFCDEPRRGNLFALRMCDSHYAIDGWRNAFKTGNFEWQHEMRYLALNPAALLRFGSLEVRTLEGISSPDKLLVWLGAFERLRDLARDVYRDPADIAMQLSALGGRGFFDHVFDQTAIYEPLLRCNTEIEYDVRDGFRLVQPLAYDLPWSVVADECAKVYIPNPFGGAKARRPRGGVGVLEAAMARVAEAAPAPEFEEDDD